MPFESRISVNGVELSVWDWPGGDPPILFCHATGFHARCWDQIVARLPGRHCIAPDLRGHGRSGKPAPPYRWRSFGEDVAELSSVLKLSGAVGVGHSMGGHSVTLAAALRTETFSTLLLLDPVIRPQESYLGPWKDAHFTAKRRNQWSAPQEMFERFESRAPFNTWDRAVLKDYCDYGLLPEGDGYVLACPPAVEAAVYQNSTLPETDIHVEIATIRIPVQVVRAGKVLEPGNIMGTSPTEPDLAAHFPHGSDLCLSDYSHFIPMEAPELVAKLIGAL